jgi:hypothetical protein
MKTVMSFFRFFLPAPGMKRKGVPLSNKILLILAICLLTLIGCLVESQEPVGETPASINPREWEGAWVSSENDPGTPRILQIFNPPQGIFLMKHKKWNEKKKQAEYSEIHWLYLRQSGDWLFASWREVGASMFLWGKIENRAMEDGGRVLLLWLPNPDKIHALIKEGLLPGRWVEEKGKKQLVLGPLLPKHYQVMRDNEQELFFKGNKLEILVRLAR